MFFSDRLFERSRGRRAYRGADRERAGGVGNSGVGGAAARWGGGGNSGEGVNTGGIFNL